MSILYNKSILVTGGTGSIGTALVEKAIKDKAKLIRIFSNDENGLYEMESQYVNHKNIEYIISSIDSSAAFLPVSASEPAPRPNVIFLPSWIFLVVRLLDKA